MLGNPKAFARRWARPGLAVFATGLMWGCTDAPPTAPRAAGTPSEYQMPWAQQSGSLVQFRSQVGGAHQPRCMDVQGGSRAAGARVTSGECSDLPQQFFRWNSGTGEIRVYDGTPDVKCLDAGAAPHHEAPLILWHCHGGAPQRFEAAPGGLAIRLQGYPGLCIDIPYGDVAPGTGLIVANCWGGAMQNWSALAVNPSAPQGLFGLYGWGRHLEFRTALAEDRCLGVEGGSRSAGARMMVAPCADAPHQTFIWDAGTHEIRVYDRTGDMKCIDDRDGLRTRGNEVRSWYCNGSAAQRWEPTPDGTGIRLQGTNLCIDVPYGDLAPGNGLILYDCWGGAMQRWRPATVLYAAMDGWQPTPNNGADHQGSGSARFTLLSGGDQVCVRATLNTTQHASIDASHIHPSPRGEGSPLDIAHWAQSGSLIQGFHAASTGRECTVVGQAAVRRILDDPDSFYFNVHTPNNPIPTGGILRGQLSRVP